MNKPPKSLTLPFKLSPIASRELSHRPSEQGGYVVLAQLPSGQPFVTWRANELGCFSGHYFDNLSDAIADYETR